MTCAKDPQRSASQHALAGYNTTRIVMEFMRWAVERDQFPTVEAIVRRFEVSRATAYRWRNYLGETYCLETLPPNEHEIARIGKPGAKARATQAGEAGR
ncbi:helix-turn-helix domain-containing protein [Stenotrophomonas lactitubi]|uniref:helix-turn-helix domain-containing protein n=1 Tax=Stenotrophomonas lactitubi TaxID=2045214 RepID=UPI00204014A4|nr:helix-turn-helix domain-containing protein [Stenotrophomonas lactitubi]